jgi:selenide,water dikinase
VCDEAGIPLAGGHSIDAPSRSSAWPSPAGGKAPHEAQRHRHRRLPPVPDQALGIGILTTAEKKGKLRKADIGLARDWMCTLNKPGSRFGKLAGVTR